MLTFHLLSMSDGGVRIWCQPLFGPSKTWRGAEPVLKLKQYLTFEIIIEKYNILAMLHAPL